MFSIVICRQLGDEWQSKTLFLTIFDLCSLIVKSVFNCCLSGVIYLLASGDFVVVTSLFIVALIVCWSFVLGSCLVMQCLVFFLVCNHLAGEGRAGCFTLIVFLLPCGCWCSVSLPHIAEGRFAVCDCGITWSYSLFSDLYQLYFT